MNGFTSTGKYSTICKFCNKRVAEAPALNIPIVGDPGKRVKDLQTIMGKHLAKHHPEQFAQGVAFIDEILSFLVFNAFEHEDPTVLPRIERIRAAVFAQVRKNTIADGMLEHVVAGIGLDTDDAGKVLEYMKAVRNACCELGPHAPDQTQTPQGDPALIVPA